MSERLDIKQRIKNANITDEVKESLRLIEDLNFFLATAPANWQKNQVIRRYYLKNDEGFISCIYWNNLYFITGTDIVRCIAYKFQHFGREILDRKKFEEGIFSDLRNLKCGTDAILEPPKSEFLNFLYKNNCLRTQKKQKVFFWFNVPHDKLMKDALDRDNKKVKSGLVPTTKPSREPSISFELGEEKLLYNLLIDQNNNKYYSSNESIDTTSTTQNSNESEIQKIAEKKEVKFETNSSPEYTTTALDKSGPDGLLNPETPDIENENENEDIQHQSDDEDFPLDYFEESSSEYITIDPNLTAYHPYMDSNPNELPYPVTQVVANDEFLIEQTLPIKTPIPLQLSAKFPTSSNPDEYYNFPPISGRFQSFPRSAFSDQSQVQFSFASSTPTQAHHPNQSIHTLPHPEFISQYADPMMNSYMVMNEYNEPVYQVMNPYQSYSLPQLQPPPNQDTAEPKPNEPIPSVTGPPSTTQTITVSPNLHAPIGSPYTNTFGVHVYPFILSPSFQGPSQRQQSISASMMKKKHQMMKGTLQPSSSKDPISFTNPKARIHKPGHPKPPTLSNINPNVNTNVSVNKETNEVLIPTPDSSKTNSEKKSS